MVITLVTFIPSVVIGFHMVRVSLFEAAADKYVSQVFNFPHTRVIECNKRYAHRGHPSQIELLLLGEPLDDGTIENARTQMRSFGLDKAELVVRQANTTDQIDVASLQQSYLELLEEKNRRIGEMAAQLKRYRVTNVEVDDISREVGAMTTNVRAISLMKGITFDVSARRSIRRSSAWSRRKSLPIPSTGRHLRLAENPHQGRQRKTFRRTVTADLPDETYRAEFRTKGMVGVPCGSGRGCLP